MSKQDASIGHEVDCLERIWVAWLGREWDRVNGYYRLKLSRPLFDIFHHPTKHGQWDPLSNTLYISLRTIKQYPWHVVVEVLKHEMAHQYVTQYSTDRESPHGPLFRRACERMALADWATSATSELPKDIPNWRESSLTEEEIKLLDKTNKLIALARSDNEHEAFLAMKKVRELYAKYNLEQLAKHKESQFVSWVLNFKKNESIFGKA